MIINVFLTVIVIRTINVMFGLKARRKFQYLNPTLEFRFIFIFQAINILNAVLSLP